MRTRPTPPNSPPKDCSPLPPERTRMDSNQNYCCVDSYSLGRNHHEYILEFSKQDI
jgi:hypothetical protein